MNQQKAESSAPSRSWRVRGVVQHRQCEMTVEAADHNAAVRYASRHRMRVESCVLIESDARVTAECPHCEAEIEDLDGFGVLHCFKCGFCTHAAITGGVCDLCGKTAASSHPSDVCK